MSFAVLDTLTTITTNTASLLWVATLLAAFVPSISMGRLLRLLLVSLCISITAAYLALSTESVDRPSPKPSSSSTSTIDL